MRRPCTGARIAERSERERGARGEEPSRFSPRRGAGAKPRRCDAFALALTAVFVIAATPTADSDLRSFGKLKTGMTVAEVRAVHPQMEELTEMLGAATVQSPHVKRYLLRDQKVAAVEQPTKVELRFWKDRLWVIVVYFSALDLENVKTMLTQRYGDLQGGRLSLYRTMELVTIVLDAKKRWYSIADDAISREAQTFFAEEMKKLHGAHAHGSPQAAQSPAPTTPRSRAPAPTGTRGP